MLNMLNKDRNLYVAATWKRKGQRSHGISLLKRAQPKES